MSDTVANPVAKDKGGGRGKRSISQRAADAEFIEHHHVRGKTEQQVTDLLNAIRPYRLSRQQIHADLQKLAEKWKESAIVLRTTAVGKELIGLQAQEDELWAAWHRSQQDRQSKTIEREGAGKRGKGIRQKTVSEGQAGDAAFQRLILDIREQRAKLLGLAAPTTIRDNLRPQQEITITNAQPEVHLYLPEGRSAMFRPPEAEKPLPTAPENGTV